MADFWISQRTIDRHLAAANAARDKRDWWEAARGYERVLASRPRLARIWVQLGNVSKESGDHRRALQAYQQALTLRPDIADIHLQLGHLAKVLGETDQARGHYARALKLDIHNPDILAEVKGTRPEGAPEAAPTMAHSLLSQPEAAEWLSAGPRIAQRFLVLDPTVIAMGPDDFRQHVTTALGLPPGTLNTVAVADMSHRGRIAFLVATLGSACCETNLQADYLGFLRRFATALGHAEAAAFLAEHLASRYSTANEFRAALPKLGVTIEAATERLALVSSAAPRKQTSTFRRVIGESGGTSTIDVAKLKELTEAIRDLAWHVGDVGRSLQAAIPVTHDPRVDDLMVILLDLADQIRETA